MFVAKSKASENMGPTVAPRGNEGARWIPIRTEVTNLEASNIILIVCFLSWVLQVNYQKGREKS